MIKFKEQKQTNSYVNNITKEEINLKLHEMLLNIFASRETSYVSNIYESMQRGSYKSLFTYIKKHIHD